MSPRRVIILGAARSGTKVFRDALAAATGAGTVPYDVNFVWRYGNESTSHDVLDPPRLSPKAVRFITGYIDRYQQNGLVIEKTVGNCLRPEFVSSVFPDAAFVHLVRDGVDAVESTRNQWGAPPDRSYLLSKLRHFPLRLIPGYGRKYAINLLRRKVREDDTAASWGVRYPGIDVDLKREGLLTVCARQWREAVTRTHEAIEHLPNVSVFVRYEDFVTEPNSVLEHTARQLSLPTSVSGRNGAAEEINSAQIGKGRRNLAWADLYDIGAEIDATLMQFGYKPACHTEAEGI